MKKTVSKKMADKAVLKKASSYGVLVCVLLTIIGGIWMLVPREPLVSVILPTYNRYSYLPMAIESTLNQTYKNLELIIIDDGSTDESVKLIKEYQQNDPRVILLENGENKGISYSRNRGHAIAKGKYIMVMDSDDYSRTNRLEKQVAFMETHPEIAVVTALRQGIGDPVLRVKPPQQKYEALELFMHYLGHPEWLVRRSFMEEKKLTYDDTYGGNVDYDMCVKMIMNGGKFGYIDEPLVMRRYHTSNPQKYYAQRSVREQEIAERFWRFFDVPEELITKHMYPYNARDFEMRVEILKFIAVKNREKKVFDQRVLEDTLEETRNEVRRQKFHAKGYNNLMDEK